MADSSVVVFKKNVPATCWLHEVYDPDVDGADPSAAGKYILTPPSPVIDRATGIVYYVHSVDSRYKHDIRAQRMLVLNEEDNISIASYGNDMFFLLYDDRVRPTLLNVDAKLVFFGQSIHEYRLVRTSTDGIVEVLSIYVDADGRVRGDRIPMAHIAGMDTVRVSTNCHTTHALTDGEQVTMQLFDTAGVQCASVTLFCRRAVLLNDLASEANPIVEFGATCLQTRGEDFFIYRKQDVDHLNIVPYVVYADGTRKDIPVDNQRCFIHGIDDFIPSFPGYKQPLVIKYHLSSRETSTINTTEGKYRYLSCVKQLVVVDNTSTYGCKVSVVPVWNYTTRTYELEYYLYTDRRDRVHRITEFVSLIDETIFIGNRFGAEQRVRISVDVAPFYDATDPVIYLQDFYITLKPGNMYERYILKDSKHDEYAYGVDVTLHRRPVIHYDSDITKYFVPTTIFTSMVEFLESFYYLSRPMYHAFSETGPVTPTHFTIRDARTGNMIITTPVPVEQYGQAWNVITIGNTDQLVGNTVIVEFLKEIPGSDFLLLQGVPVDVYSSQVLVRGGYNTPDNNLF